MTLSERYARGLYNDWQQLDKANRALMIRAAYMNAADVSACVWDSIERAACRGFLKLVNAHGEQGVA